MSIPLVPETTAHVRIVRQSWQEGKLYGEVIAGSYQWQFQWCFPQGKMIIQPSLGRALIQEPLTRFLETHDYQLETGGDYQFQLRSRL